MAKRVPIDQVGAELERLTNKFHTEHVKSMAMATLRRVPIDSGQARNSISISQAVPIVFVGSATPSASQAIGFIRRADLNIRTKSYVVSGVEYSWLLEYGRSDQAPTGFMRNTAREANLHAKRVARQMRE